MHTVQCTHFSIITGQLVPLRNEIKNLVLELSWFHHSFRISNFKAERMPVMVTVK